MRHTILVAVALLVSVESTSMAQGRRGGSPDSFGPAAARGTSSVAGRVLTPDTNAPVRAADVVATSSRGGRAATTTDENGAYLLNGLSDGEWSVTASKGGYVNWQYGQRRPFQLPSPISLARGQRFTANIPLSRGGAISGRIYDASGDAVAGVQVRVYRATIERGSRRLKAVGAADMTDDLGAFRVYGLPPGDYYVAASLRVAPIDSVVETTFAPTYFPGTGDLAEAQRVKLGLGTEITATFPLLPVRPARVSGSVLTTASTPANAFLSLESEASEFGTPIGVGGVTRSDGTFTLADVAPGRYLLKASLRGDGPDESGDVAVAVYGEDLAGVTVVTGRPATIRGTIRSEAGVRRRLPPDLKVIAYSARQSGMVLGSGDGLTFEIDSLSEPFRLAVEGLPDDLGVKHIVVGDLDALDGPIELSPGQQAVARVVLTDRLTEVSGVAAPIDSSTPASVVVFPENSAKWGQRSRYIGRVQTDARGGFRIVGLPPGERYLAFAADYLDEGEHLDPEFLTGVRSVAVPFSLDDDADIRTIELKVVER